MQTNKPSSPPACLSSASPPSSPPHSWYKDSILYLWLTWTRSHLLFKLDDLLSFSPCYKTASGRNTNCSIEVVVLTNKRTRESSWATQSCELITDSNHPDGRLGRTPAQKPLKCNDAVRLIFGGGSVILTPLFVLISRRHIIQLPCCYLISQAYHLNVYCKQTIVMHMLCEAKPEIARNYQQHLWTVCVCVLV